MSRNDPVDPRVRLAITQWPPDAPRGAVTTFCVEHSISRKTFYEIHRRTVADGPAAALEPRSRRPKSSPTTLTDEVQREALGVRAALERSGLDHGPISVHDKMRSLGMSAPSPASLARIFRDAGVARLEPKKKPRAAYRRFVYPAPNACWQLDATETVLTGGRKCVIFQLIDDHARYAVASHVAWGETADAAIVVVDKGIALHGVPQRLLTDNGVALNPSRRGHLGQLLAHVSRLGVEAITGKPYKPTTQGKNERFHQTLFCYLDKQPMADSLGELQAQVDEFDRIYNTQRPHQGLPGRVTPLTAWQATPKAEAPRPKPDRPKPQRAASTDSPVRTIPIADGMRILKLRGNGSIRLRKITYMVDGQRAGDDVLVIDDDDTITIADLDGTVLIEHTRPTPGIKYVGNGRPRGRRPRTTAVSPMP